MDFSNVVSRDEWLVARKALLVKEKAATQTLDALRAERQALPLVRVDKAYSFEGPDGQISLLELFGEHKQLIVQHFMFDPEWEKGCPGCTYFVDGLSADHLPFWKSKDTSFVVVSRAPLAKLEAWKTQRGWDVPWISSYGSDFNYDFHATHDERVAPIEHNFRDKAELGAKGMKSDLRGEVPGFSVFVRDGETIYHSYSTFDRGSDILDSRTQFLDLTPLGRQD